MIKSSWSKLDHNQKRWIAIASGIGAVVLVVYLVGGDGQDGVAGSKNKRKDAIRAVLTDKNTRDVSIDALSANMSIISRENRDLKKELEKLQRNLDRENNKVFDTSGISNEIKRLKKDLDKLQKDSKGRELEYKESIAQQKLQMQNAQTPSMPSEDSDDGFPVASASSGGSVFDEAPEVKPQFNSETGERVPLKIVSHVQPQPKKEPLDETDEEVYMPAASIMSGVLLNGLDAPTGQGARKDPFPVAMRIQKEAILPNHYRADVRECFSLAAGYGDLSTERAFLRTEVISCVRNDGGVIEARLKGYVVGEDGKAGLRGRLVSKQGQIIAKSLMAGFMSGAASAFDVNPVPVINTSPTSNTQFQGSMGSEVFQGAAAKGASTALDRVAKFYIEMAESMFPVVEIDAGRRVDIVITGGVKLKIRQ